MHKIFISIIVTAIIFASSPAEARISKPMLTTIVTMITGAGAALSASEVSQAIKDTLTIKERGINTQHNAVYQISFELNPSTAERYFLHPNVYALISFGRHGEIIPATIIKRYKGEFQKITFLAPDMSSGQRVTVQMLDDGHWTRLAWDKLLIGRHPIINNNYQAVAPIEARSQRDGTIKILDRDLTLKAPTGMAAATITVPNSKNWLADVKLVDKNNNHVGRMVFRHIATITPFYARPWFITFIIILTAGALYFSKDKILSAIRR